MRAIVRLTDEVLKLNAKVEVSRHKATMNANTIFKEVDIARSVGALARAMIIV